MILVHKKPGLMFLDWRDRGKLSKAWLPVEFVTIDFLPQRYRMPRRWA